MIVLLAIALILVLAPVGARSARAEESCLQHAAEAEREFGIPTGMLQSLAMVESGADDNPFAISLQGRAVMARDIKVAAKLLRDRRGNLRTNTYVGCMQLSLQAHRSQFNPIERIVDPRTNVWYAARLLSRLHGEEGNWRVALTRYNGGSLESTQKYVCKVWRNLSDIDLRSAALLEMPACLDNVASVAPRSRQVRQNQVAAIN